MRIRQLRLEAFGHFSARTLELKNAQNDLHIIYGPNEAGKSTALRALRGLLFGIDERSSDSFIHQPSQLRVGGRLELSDGKTLNLVRRKGRKNTLADEDGEGLDDRVLKPFMGGVTSEVFDHLFGLDHSALVKGGEDILRQQGDVGKALFSAASGQQHIDLILADLEAQAGELYRARGAKQKINQTLGEYRIANQASRDAMLSAKVWQEKQSRLEKIGRQLELLEIRLAETRRELARLQRIKRVQPRLALRQHQKSILDELAETPLLPQEFSKKRTLLTTEIAKITFSLKDLEQRKASLQKRLVEDVPQLQLIGQKKQIETLYARLSHYQQNLKDAPLFKVAVSEIKERITELQGLLGYSPDIFLNEKLRLVLSRRQSLIELAKQKQSLTNQILPIKQAMAKSEVRIQQSRDSAPVKPVKGIKKLQHVIADAKREGDIEQAITQLRANLQQLEMQVAQSSDALRLPELNRARILQIQMPSLAAITGFENDFDGLRQQEDKLQIALTETGKKLAETRLALEKMGLDQSLPGLADLKALRDVRDQLLSSLDVSVLENETLNDHRWQALKTALRDTDFMVDRLLQESERLHRAERLGSDIQAMDRQSQKLGRELQEVEQQRADLTAEWIKFWKKIIKIAPRSPREMEAFVHGYERLKELLRQLLNEEQKLDELEQKKHQYQQQLAAELKACGYSDSQKKNVSLPGLIERGEVWLAELQQQESRWTLHIQEKQTLERDRQEHQAQLSELQQALSDWEQIWVQAIRSAGIELAIEPADLDEFLSGVRELLEGLKKREQELTLLKEKKQFIEQFENACRQLHDIFADGDFDYESAETTLLSLHEQLELQLALQTRNNQLADQLTQAAEQETSLSGQLIQLQAQITELCSIARCPSIEQLEAVELRALQKVQAHQQCEQLEQQIIEEGNGLTLDQLCEEALSVDTDLLPARVSELENDISEEFEPQRLALVEQRGQLLKELELMDGGDRAARAAEKAQGLLAEIRQDSEQYIRLKLAIQLLNSQIESYRQSHQGPLLTIASQYFSKLTLGSFERLSVEFDGHDQAVLAGVRGGRDVVHVDGMSSGTRDQLYLALRLAAIERYQLEAEAMPFIVDDVLVEFDDQRSMSALEQLRNLSANTQVLVFTHHQRIVEQAGMLSGINVCHL